MERCTTTIDVPSSFFQENHHLYGKDRVIDFPARFPSDKTCGLLEHPNVPEDDDATPASATSHRLNKRPNLSPNATGEVASTNHRHLSQHPHDIVKQLVLQVKEITGKPIGEAVETVNQVLQEIAGKADTT